MSKPSLRLVPEGKPATLIAIAQVERRALDVFRGLSEPERLRKADAIVNGILPMAIVAAEIIGMQQAEFAARVENLQSLFVPVLKQVADATNDAKTVVDILHAAECRLAVALANIEQEGSPSRAEIGGGAEF
jgi:hypothetical protein